MARTTPIISPGLEQTLLRVLSLVNDEMMELSSYIQDIKFSTYRVINMLEGAVEKEKRDEAARLWLNKLEEVAYEAEDVLDDLSYEISCQKVRNNSCVTNRSLKKRAFNSQLAKKVKNVSYALQIIEDGGKDHLRPSERSSLAFRSRLCLEFCLSFPQDYSFGKTELIHLWIAAGLLQSFDEGNYCFLEIVHDTLQDVEKDEEGNVVLYKMKGLDRDSSSEYNNTSLYATTSMSIPKDRAKKLRTLILDGVPFQELWNLERLRILVFLNIVGMEMFPSSIERLKHLRYLDVSNTGIRALPEFVTKLYNLQTLRFLQCNELNELPKKFNNLINLKNIAFSFEHQIPFGLGLLICLETLSFFAVGSNRGGDIQELRNLNGLRGYLEITRLEELRSRKEAEGANLQQKAKINGLSFQWSYGAHDRSSSDAKVLEGLKPHPNIRKIKIKYYMGENWPSWMLRTKVPSDGDSFVLHNLASLTLERCWNCTELPCLGDLPFLRFLAIQHMVKVKCIYNELYRKIGSEGNSCFFPALISLSLSWMEDLTEWRRSAEMPLNNKVFVFPRLEILSIQCCPKLTSFPMRDLSSVVEIRIKDCNELRFLLHGQQPFPFLKNLSIEGCPKLTRFQNWLLSDMRHTNLIGLLKFRVRRCEWLNFVSDDLGLQSSLVSLELNCCKGFTFFSEKILCKLTQLRKLSIGAFSEKLDDFRFLNQIKDLGCLEELEIWGSDFLGRKMSYLPNQLQHLTRLESLKITGFTAMNELPEWLVDLPSLRCISLNYCWRLEYQSTAAIILRLSKLEQVYIYGCYTLEQNRSQWNELSSISKLRIHFHCRQN